MSKEVNMQIYITNKWLYTLFTLSILLLLATSVIAYNSIPNPGHGADYIVVTVNGQDKNLQQAITDIITDINTVQQNCVEKVMRVYCYTEGGNYRDCMIVPEGTPQGTDVPKPIGPLPRGYWDNYDWIDVGPAGYSQLICS